MTLQSLEFSRHLCRASVIIFPPFLIEQNDTMNECPHCFCKPCITHEINRQMWWKNNSEPKAEETESCEKKYIRNSGLCCSTDKCLLMAAITRGKWEHFTKILEDKMMFGIYMTICQFVRSWLPNLDGHPYMGHKWEWLQILNIAITYLTNNKVIIHKPV
jgi:hypothetical protein